MSEQAEVHKEEVDATEIADTADTETQVEELEDISVNEEHDLSINEEQDPSLNKEQDLSINEDHSYVDEEHGVESSEVELPDMSFGYTSEVSTHTDVAEDEHDQPEHNAPRT